jgi:hypothetical protein
VAHPLSTLHAGREHGRVEQNRRAASAARHTRRRDQARRRRVGFANSIFPAKRHHSSYDSRHRGTG